MLLETGKHRYRKLHCFMKTTENEHPSGWLDFKALSLARVRAVASFYQMSQNKHFLFFVRWHMFISIMSSLNLSLFFLSSVSLQVT